jgi:hypothetical protein
MNLQAMVAEIDMAMAQSEGHVAARTGGQRNRRSNTGQ